MGTMTATIEREPDMRPAAPMPATARPMISMGDEVAAAETTEPRRKMRKKDMNVHLSEKLA
jgi:hypothetical protein